MVLSTAVTFSRTFIFHLERSLLLNEKKLSLPLNSSVGLADSPLAAFCEFSFCFLLITENKSGKFYKERVMNMGFILFFEMKDDC